MLRYFEPQITQLVLIPGAGGRFEVTVDDVLIYSKLGTGRHAEPGEVVEALRQHMQRSA